MDGSSGSNAGTDNLGEATQQVDAATRAGGRRRGGVGNASSLSRMQSSTSDPQSSSRKAGKRPRPSEDESRIGDSDQGREDEAKGNTTAADSRPWKQRKERQLTSQRQDDEHPAGTSKDAENIEEQGRDANGTHRTPQRLHRRGGAKPGAPSSRPRRNQPENGTAHGSYGAYYMRRVDDRVPLLKPDWTSRPGARVLDVGCNDGSVTLRVARERQPVSVVGIDIDPALVTRARAQLRALLRDAKRAAKPVQNTEQSESRETVSTTGNSGASSARPSTACRTPPLAERFPFNVTFRVEDFATANETLTSCEKGSFDVVLMLSVTKWVHLHGGDEALKRFFARARECLRPGGVLVLEPQPIISYKRAQRKLRLDTEKNKSIDQATPILARVSSLKLEPDMFPNFLLSKEGGFHSMLVLRGLREKGQPFNRPIFAFVKGQEGESVDKASVDLAETFREQSTAACRK